MYEKIKLCFLFIKMKETGKKQRNNEDVKEEAENMRKEIDELNDDMNSLQRVLNFIKVISLSILKTLKGQNTYRQNVFFSILSTDNGRNRMEMFDM